MNLSLINLARNYKHTVNEQAAGMKDSKSTVIMHIKRYLHNFSKRRDSDGLDRLEIPVTISGRGNRLPEV